MYLKMLFVLEYLCKGDIAHTVLCKIVNILFVHLCTKWKNQSIESLQRHGLLDTLVPFSHSKENSKWVEEWREVVTTAHGAKCSVQMVQIQ